MFNFTHLHVHTDMSSRDGIATIPSIIKKASKLGMTACAITDHGNLQGIFEFYNQAKNNNIKPIIGCEVYFAPGLDVKHGEASPVYHLTLLAKNDLGYHNLIKICSFACENFYRVPRVTTPLLEKYNQGVIGMSACLGGELPQLLLAGQFDEAMKRSKWYNEIFNGDFYYEIMRNGYQQQDVVNENLIKLSGNIEKLVATNDTHYLNEEDSRLRLVVSHIAQNYDEKEEEGELWFKSQDEMLAKFSDMPELLENTMKLADSCETPELGFKQYIYPSFAPESGKDFDTEIHDNAWAGLKKRGLDDNPDYRERLEHELEIIKKYNFSTYLLIVADIIGYARKNDIPVGPGRGSAAGSLVCYCLEITDIDPIRWNLSFERFINPERVSLPDIDMDICANRREEVIEYLVNKYGKEYVAYISTISTWAKKGAVRAVGQSMIKNGKGILQNDINELSNIIDAYEKANPDDKKSLTEMLEMGLFDNYVKNNPYLRECVEDAIQVEGIANAFGSHAAGIIISNVPMTDIVATTIIRKKDEKDKIAVQCDMGHVEKNCGLIKMDLLGLKNMTIIYKAIENIKKQGKMPPDVRNLPVDNEKAYKFYSMGDTLGIFQMEKDGMRQTAQRLRPTCFEDIIALVAMYRPGPIKSGMVDSFIKRKHGEEEISYYGLDKYLEPILKETYGLIIYQEQVMKIAQALAGYTAGGADILRRAMGKKKQEEMDKQEAVFMEGARKMNMPENTVKEIFDAMSKFAQYGFNKSHAAAYAYISYVTAYLKAEFPVEFMAAVIEMEDDPAKSGAYIEIAKNFCNIVQPDFMLSGKEITVHNDKIFLGLSGIKGLPTAAIDDLLIVRETWKKDKMPDNFVELMQASPKFNLKFLETMNKAGAFDSFIGNWKNRAFVDKNKDAIKDCAAKSRKKKVKNITGLLGELKKREMDFLGIPSSEFAEWSGIETAQHERDVLGICVSGIDILEGASIQAADSQNRMTIENIKELVERFTASSETEINLEQNKYVLAIISDFKINPYKADKDKPNPRKFFRCNISDNSGTLEIKGFDGNWKGLATNNIAKGNDTQNVHEILEKGNYQEQIWKIGLSFQKDRSNPEIVNILMKSAEVAEREENCLNFDVVSEKVSAEAQNRFKEILKTYECSESDPNGYILHINYTDQTNSEIADIDTFLIKNTPEAKIAIANWCAKCHTEKHEITESEKKSVKFETSASITQLTLF